MKMRDSEVESGIFYIFAVTHMPLSLMFLWSSHPSIWMLRTPRCLVPARGDMFSVEAERIPSMISIKPNLLSDIYIDMFQCLDMF